MRVGLITPVVSHYHHARFSALHEFGLNACVITTKNEGHFKEFLANPGEICYDVCRVCSSRDEYNLAISNGTMLAILENALRRIQPNVLVMSGWYGAETFAGLSIAKEYGIPTVVMSESQADDAPRSFIREAIKKRIVSHFDAGLVGGPPHADYVAKLGMARERIHFGYNAVDNAYFGRGADMARASQTDLKAQYQLPARYLLASARFITKKNLPNLICAYALARRKYAALPDLLILGDGPERAAVEEAIVENGVEAFVHLPGFRSYGVLPVYYALSEGFLHVSSTEQWGLVINEAMASGVPVIATRTCGAARTVIRDGVNGLLTDIDVASISDAILRLFEMTERERASMGAAAKVAIKEWGPERFGAGLRAAVDCAANAYSRTPLKPWDKILMRRFQRGIIDAVS